MRHFVDRRLNPKDKNLGNRQRFMRRARAQIKKVVNDSIKNRSITNVDEGETVSIPTKGIGEPRFHHSPTGGYRERVFPGNKEFNAGDKIQKPVQGGGEGGKKASDQGEAEDAFTFELTREEFLDIYFEDLELPDLVKKDLKEIKSFQYQRAGYSLTGTPNQISVRRTIRHSLGRRIAMSRPKLEEVELVQEEIDRIEDEGPQSETDLSRLAALKERLEKLVESRRSIPYLDPVDIRYKRLERTPKPNTKAVMFCLMDVSGSMGEREKELAKRFFILLHLFLKRRYRQTDIVFIRHTHEASEVDEETFFYSRESGGTVVSTALTEMLKVLRDRYPPDSWNVYAAQASDGDNFPDDGDRCVNLLQNEIMPLCQYFAYVEIIDERELDMFQAPNAGAELWQAYQIVRENWSNFEMKHIARPGDIYPVFRELFAKQPADA
ncbi:MAG: YeaH/YhbH family protein [Alphaproteobacteria bacterium]|nr:YeaH/YhbH family protein [Alphaproteobacteria bacterium]